MNSYKTVANKINQWKSEGKSKSYIVVSAANLCMGWPYVFGGRGEICTPSNRKARADNAHPTIVSECQVLSGKKTSCEGCQWHQDGDVLFFDCRGFTYWLFKLVGITINGAGATSQYNNNSNWEEKGPISQMPRNKVCCVFRYDNDTGKMEHTLLYDGEGNYIHCSGTVKKVKTSKYKATHYAIPKGLNSGGGDMPVTGETATVYAPSGSFVNMRKKESTLSLIVTRVPIGSTIEVTSRGDEWCAVKYDGKSGYMMTKFIRFGQADTYTCTIRGLTKEQADEIAKQYKNCTVTQG